MSDPLKLTIGAYDISAEDYHADPCVGPSLSNTAANLINICPLKAYLSHPRLNPNFEPRVASAKMNFGSIGHKLLLGKGAEIDILDEKDWKKDAAQAFRDRATAAGRLPCLRKDYDRARELQSGALREFKRLGLLEDFEASIKERTYIWRDDNSYLRSMIDAVLVDPGAAIATIFDLKITGDASPEACVGRIGSMGYDLQAHFQKEAVKSVNKEIGLSIEGRMKHIFLNVEDEFPYLVTPVELSAEVQAIGRSKFNRALHTWKQCLADNRWPGYTAGVVVAEAKPWDTKREMEAAGILE